MKKLIALILIPVITSFIVVTRDSTPLIVEMVMGNVKNPDSKDKNWEYVKDRLFEGEIGEVYKLEGPILIDLTDPTKQDSLAVEETIRELRTILPNRTIDYFKNFVGKSFEKIEPDDYRKNFKGFDLHSLLKTTIRINFVEMIPVLPNNQYSRIGDNNEIERSVFYKNGESIYNENIIVFSFNKLIPFERRKRNIQYEIYRKLCYINPTKIYAISPDEQGVFNTPDYVPDQAKLNELDKFLLQKLYSDDFIDQFKTYLYAKYPWRYASLFVNKNMAEFRAFSIIIAIGILVFVLMFSYFQDKKFKYTYLDYLFPIFFISIHFCNLVNIYDYLADLNEIISWDDKLESAIKGTIIISFLLWGLEKIGIKGNMNFSSQLMLKVIFTFVSFITPIAFIYLQIPEAQNHIELFRPYFILTIGLAFGRGLLIYLNHFSDSLVKEKEVELSRLREAKAEAEVKMLQSQINPHFLYNALNSIASLAHTDANKTEKMALSLSDLFRHTINRKEEKINTLEDEVNLVRNYLEIEQIRFGDRLRFSIAVEPDLLAVEIPMFILQPLVENAIKHGISKMERQGIILLKISKKDNGVLISVQDNGPDFPEGLVSGHGLQTVYDLLRFSYGDKAEISWHNRPKKEITIYIFNNIGVLK